MNLPEQLMNKIIQGDCLEVLKTLEENSVDAVVTDPPYELGFMGKSWDASGIAYSVEMWREVLRVLKPGGHLLSFGGSRTYHRMACAIEDAGFEIRDQIQWVYASGFPKSLNISKAMSNSFGIGLCTCVVPEQMLYSKNEEDIQRENKTTLRDDDRQGVGGKNRSPRKQSGILEEERKDTNISLSSSIKQDSEMLSLQEKNDEEKQGLEEVSESVLLKDLPQSIHEKEGYGNSAIRTGVESDKGKGAPERQSMSSLQEERTESIGSSPSSAVQNGWQKHDGKSNSSLQNLSSQDRGTKQQDTVSNQDKSEIRERLYKNGYLCSQCGNLRKDIGGSALKPAHEPIVLARKPLSEKTVAENVLRWGTGGLNIDECRVETNKDQRRPSRGGENGLNGSQTFKIRERKVEDQIQHSGRFPANFIHDNSEEVRECFPDSGGGAFSKSGGRNLDGPSRAFGAFNQSIKNAPDNYGDQGNASRFFKSIIYTAKSSKSERNKGLEGFEEKQTMGGGGLGRDNPDLEKVAHAYGSIKAKQTNSHPTVKPISLMRYLCKLVTPPNGTVLDPFLGSGTTGIAAKLEGFNFIGIEKEPEYVEIAKARIQAWDKEAKQNRLL